MEITVLYVEDCPHWRLAEARLHEALRAMGAAARLRRHRVDTPQEAERLGFHGSPTILLDGHDLFAQQPAPAGLSCRIYQTDAGAAGAPTVSQLTTLLARRPAGGTGSRPPTIRTHPPERKPDRT